MSKKRILFSDLTKIAFNISFTSFGGGSTAIPLIRKLVVEEQNMISQEEFDTMAIMCNVFPGPVITQLLALIGYKVGGIKGVFAILWPIVTLVPVLFVIAVVIFQKILPVEILEKISIALIPTILFLTTDYMVTIMQKIISQNKLEKKWLVSVTFSIIGVVLLYVLPTSMAIIAYIAILCVYALLLMQRDKGVN